MLCISNIFSFLCDSRWTLWCPLCLITLAEKYPTQLLGYFHFTKFVYIVPVIMDV